ncbi:4-hydroxy-tetrahydrodipicolinate synthase [Janibacter indicus]|uniref:4-hydroxy-tetrahydrodipicolinate synthase n=2 Tax=Janibacter indicus TaxID=857417 RepID=A0A1W2C6K5_9MICO|nr:4-hydroxy-tetrahydrodipicolinate synthase [Janibacter indicus]
MSSGTTVDAMSTEPTLGQHLVAMVTPMTPDGRVSRTDVERLVDHLVDGGCDGIVVAGTTGEAPTLTREEVSALIATVASRTKGAARVIAGVGNNVTADSIAAAREAAAAGADGLLLVTPYYSRPSQAGLVEHCTAVAGATDVPVLLYDVPVRTGTALTPASLARLAELPTVVGIKDAKGDLVESMTLARATGLDHYCGSDELNLPHLAAGAVGLVSVVANLAPRLTGRLIDAVRAGRLDEARSINAELMPLALGLMRPGPGAATAKAALTAAGIISSAAVRLPMVEEPLPHAVKIWLSASHSPAA